jgi:osmotically-inducible protein OsmY
MDKHYGWQEGRGAQGQGRPQNGQRWNERSRDDDRDMRGARGGDYGGGWDRDDRRWASGGDLDREDYMSEDEEYGGPSRGFGGARSQGQGRWSQSAGPNRGPSSQYGGGQYGGNQGFSGGHYGGFANEGYSGQGNSGGNRGFSDQGYSGQRFNQGSTPQGRYAGQGAWNQGGWGQSGQSGQNWGQTFGEGYSGSEYGNQGVGSGAQRYSGQGVGSQSRSLGQSYGQSYGSGYQGRGFAGRGPKGYTRSDDRIKEQVSDRLMDDDNIDASEISIDVKNGEVTLSGTVSSREEKRAAEDAAEQTPGVPTRTF